MRAKSPAKMLFDSLESRTYLSATSVQLNADYQSIVSSKSTYTAAITSVQTQLLTGAQALAADIPNAKASAPAEHKALADLKKATKTIKKLTSTFANDAVKLSAKALKAGNTNIAKPSTANAAKVQKAGLALENKTRADLQNINGDTTLNTFYADLDVIVAANPTNTALATDVHSLESNVTLNAVINPGNSLTSALIQFETDLGVLNTTP